MFKLLYAVDNSFNARLQLERFMEVAQHLPITIKIAAYQKSSPKNININWTLDCLTNIFHPKLLSFKDGGNDNFQIYYQQIKYYQPDLIISDMEYFTSYIATVLNIPLWQCSSRLITFGSDRQWGFGLFKKYGYFLHRNSAEATQQQINIIDNSNQKFIYSHLGDTNKPPILKNGFEWIRPYHCLGKLSPPCRHHLTAATIDNNKKIYQILQRQKDCVAFSEFPYESYQNIILKDIDQQSEYYCNLKNCDVFVCEGQTNFLADAFYNQKYTAILLNYNDVECLINSVYSEDLKLSTTIYTNENDLDRFSNEEINFEYNNKIEYLHQKIERLL
jgi:uncharacterized protein (TIGR00661 family)